MEAASLELIEQRALQRRVDTKQIVARSLFEKVFAGLDQDYALVMSSQRRKATYRNLYFDTEDHLCLREHHRGRRPRYKVRIRHHVDRSLSFLEIKEKRHGGITKKYRKPIPFMQEDINAEALSFIEANCPLPARSLHPSIRIDFERITLVGCHLPERVTFDSRICFSKADDTPTPWNHGVIVEIKQERYKPRSPIMLALRKARAQSVSISKYCTGAYLLLPDVKMNLYKDRFRFIRRRFND
jgi:hypothetical protein